MKKLILLIMLFSIFTIGINESNEIHARKWRFKYKKKKSGKIKVIRSFISNSKRVQGIQPRSNRIAPGTRIYFYYKVGPMKCIRGKGTPFKTRLVVKRDGRMLKDFGWSRGNAASSSQRRRNQKLTWYHSANWNLNLSRNIKPGNYIAIVTHSDQNSRKTLNIRYNFIITGRSRSSHKINLSQLKRPRLLLARVKRFGKYSGISYGYGVSLKWREPNSRFTHWQVQYNLGSNWIFAYNNIKRSHRSWVNHHGNKRFRNTTMNLNSGASYRYRVRTCKRNKCSDWSNVLSAKIPRYSAGSQRNERSGTGRLLSGKATGNKFINQLKRKKIKSLMKYIYAKTDYSFCDPNNSQSPTWSKQRAKKIFKIISKGLKNAGETPSANVSSDGLSIYIGILVNNASYDFSFKIKNNKWVIVSITEDHGCN